MPAVERLLDLKMNSPEIKLIPRVDEINGYMTAELEKLRAEAETIVSHESCGWEPLNAFFRELLEK